MNFHEQKKEALEIIAASKSRDWRKIVDNLLDKNMFGYHGISLQSCKRLFPVVLVKFEQHLLCVPYLHFPELMICLASAKLAAHCLHTGCHIAAKN